MTPTLLTGRYHDHSVEDGVAVAISLGQPKWPLPYPLEHEVRDLMPVGIFGRDLPWPEFEQLYSERLDRIGVDRLREQFDEIANVAPDRPIVLLCWEKAGEPCHRRLFSDWWHAQTGEDVPESRAVKNLPKKDDAISGQLYLELDR